MLVNKHKPMEDFLKPTSTSNAPCCFSDSPASFPLSSCSYILDFRSKIAYEASIVGRPTASSSISLAARALTPLLGRLHIVDFYSDRPRRKEEYERSRSQRIRRTHLHRFVSVRSGFPHNLIFSNLPLLSSEFSLQVEERACTDPCRFGLAGRQFGCHLARKRHPLEEDYPIRKNWGMVAPPRSKFQDLASFSWLSLYEGWKILEGTRLLLNFPPRQYRHVESRTFASGTAASGTGSNELMGLVRNRDMVCSLNI